MNKPNRYGYGRQPNQPSKKFCFIPPNAVEHFAEQESSSNNSQESNPKPNTDTPNRKKWSRADLIGLGMLVATALLTWYTGGLFSAASDTTLIKEYADAAKESSKAAKDLSTTTRDVFHVTKSYYDSSIKKQKELIDNERGIADRQFSKDTAVLGIQRRALQETQKQFELSNRSLLQAANFDTVALSSNKPLIKFVLQNLGVQPAKIIKNTIYFNSKPLGYYKTADDAKADLKNLIHILPLDDFSYVDKSAPLTKNLGFTEAFDKEGLKNLKASRVTIYIAGVFDYENLLTTKKQRYEFMAEMVFRGINVGYNFIYNDTKELP